MFLPFEFPQNSKAEEGKTLANTGKMGDNILKSRVKKECKTKRNVIYWSCSKTQSYQQKRRFCTWSIIAHRDII
jgi:hypothetical protein